MSCPSNGKKFIDISYDHFVNIEHSIFHCEQFAVRNVLGTKTLGDILSDRESIALEMQTVLDEGTEPWGVKVERVEVTLTMTSITSIILLTMTIATMITRPESPASS